MINVFLSSTAKDLALFRRKAADAINRLNGLRCVQMENWGAVDSPAEKYDSDKIAAFDLSADREEVFVTLKALKPDNYDYVRWRAAEALGQNSGLIAHAA